MTVARIVAIAAVALLWEAPAAAQQTELPAVAPRLARLVPPRPTPASFIADVPNVIPAAAQRDLDVRIRAVQDSGWGDIGVAILRSIEDYQPYEVGVAIYRTWRIGRIDSIGRARRDLGVLLLIVPKELAPDNQGRCWITTGLGAEGIITDATASAICRDQVVPYLIRRDYAGGVGAAVAAIADRVRADRVIASQPIGRSPEPLRVVSVRKISGTVPLGPVIWVVALTGAAIAMFVVLRWRRNRPRVCPNCGRTMRRMSDEEDDAVLSRGQQLEEKIRSVDYDVWRCACGERLTIPYSRWFSGYSDCRRCGVRATRSERLVLSAATTVSPGLAETTYTCLACKDKRVVQEVLPQLPDPATTAASGASHGGFGGGGGGGSSGGDFGGSGRTSGGGGGASY